MVVLVKKIVMALLCLPACIGALASAHPCADDAKERARKLLSFHVDLDGLEDRIGFEGLFVASPLKNPANRKQVLEVLEVTGFIQPHGEYRMRFIYYRKSNRCDLRGQEILERANF
jgi:hypothetical protein